MMRIFSIIISLLTFQAVAFAQLPETVDSIKAPFDMPQLHKGVFPKRYMNISKAGAKEGKLCTSIIQSAIDKLSKRGGGTVIIPRGKWLTGRITLKSNICLQIDADAELHFSGDVKDYLPAVACRNEGVDIYGPGAMIYADGADNIAIIGKGKLVASARDCELLQLTMAGIPESVQDMPLSERVFDSFHPNSIPFANANLNNSSTREGREGAFPLCLPVFIGPMNSTNILIEGITLEGSVFWNIVPVYCENIIIRGVTVSSAGIARTDGIDIDSSRNTLIEYATLDCGDDCFTLKSGRGMDGLQKARPTENVVIRHCTAKRGAGGLTVGSETAAGIRNVYMYDVTIENPKYGIYFKTRRPRGGGGENMWFEDIHMVQPKTRAIYWDMLGSATYVGKLAERAPLNLPEGEKSLYANTDIKSPWDKLGGVLTPYFRNIHFTNVTIDHCTDFIKAIGLPESPIEDVTFKNISSPECKKVTLQDVGKFTIE